jgi:hypothetical protein
MVGFVHDIFIKSGYGPPKVIMTDNGKEVTNKLIKSIYQIFIFFL